MSNYQRAARQYAALIAGIVRDFGVPQEVAAAICARAVKHISACEDCGKSYDRDGKCECPP